MLRLPVSGVEVALRPPAGADDILLCESPEAGPELALALLERVATVDGAEDLDWGALPSVDLQALLIALRQIVFGDVITCDVACVSDGCGARMDVSFRLSVYLDHHRPSWPRGLETAAVSGWYHFSDGDVSFRLPSVADRLAALANDYPMRELAARCIAANATSPAKRRRAERAMTRLAPSLSHELEAQCPECGATTAFYFDVEQFVLAELRRQASYVYEDVHRIASTYHWPEQDILAISSSRRRHYCDSIDSERSGY